MIGDVILEQRGEAMLRNTCTKGPPTNSLYIKQICNFRAEIAQLVEQGTPAR